MTEIWETVMAAAGSVPPLLWLCGPLVGLVGMFAGGFWGVGCGWLIVPTMLLLGLSPLEAVGISLLQMVPSTLPTVLRTAGDIGWGTHSLGRMVVLPMGAAAFVGSFAGEPVNQWLNATFGANGLTLLFAVVMVIIGLQTLGSRAADNPATDARFGGRAAAGAMGVGAVTGVFSSVLGVGGAVLMRPALASGFKASVRETAVAVRILLLVTTLTGGVTYLLSGGEFQPRVLVLTLLIAGGGMLGFPCGVRLHNAVAAAGYGQVIHKSFAAIALIVVISALLKLAGLESVCRVVMLSFAIVLVSGLLILGSWTKRHPRVSGEAVSAGRKAGM